jgi:hypothetical protein
MFAVHPYGGNPGFLIIGVIWKGKDIDEGVSGF